MKPQLAEVNRKLDLLLNRAPEVNAPARPAQSPARPAAVIPLPPSPPPQPPSRMEHGTITTAQTIQQVEELNVELENPTFRRGFMSALKAINRHGFMRSSVRAAMDAIMEPGVACQFNMCGRHRQSKKPTPLKVAFNKMTNIIECIVEAYKGRPIDKAENVDKFGGSEGMKVRWIMDSIAKSLVGAPDALGQSRQITRVESKSEVQVQVQVRSPSPSPKSEV
jgi:hypothetical protein